MKKQYEIEKNGMWIQKLDVMLLQLWFFSGAVLQHITHNKTMSLVVNFSGCRVLVIPKAADSLKERGGVKSNYAFSCFTTGHMEK